MLDPVIAFFERIFNAIGRGFGMVVAAILWPFVTAAGWYRRRGFILKAVVGGMLLIFVGLYGYFFWQTQVWTNFDVDYPAKREAYAATPGAQQADGTCAPSAMVSVTADLIDFNVNQNAWISSMILHKAGFFGIEWNHTPFFDNKAAFQRGVNQAIRRTTVEFVDTLGRVRGTSQVDGNLQDARGSLQFDEYTWYFGINPFGPKTPTPSFYRSAIKDLATFNDRLSKCEATYDARADNLVQFLDRIASDVGSTSAILRDRSENFNAGWFDTRADDRFWFAYGQLYGYYGILKATREDFRDVVVQRNLGQLWDSIDTQLAAALRIQPAIISNGNESGWIMPTHLATMGFYVLRFRSNLVEVRAILDR
ncbi:MAG: DUF2333 family protein [Hoeflea sp.]|uniref:DUF2333 family protein n=1 Tax=Hoeflea sp. TaxID=1940281 RepID=UPI0027309B83|nr:DUF2333 family protein [Hoeflea sp.]MDP2121638.1 DUF2333 family protein [Hoeflea sp.]MDZ7603191.1 DUF2333 family protein [Hoeflea sp.]